MNVGEGLEFIIIQEFSFYKAMQWNNYIKYKKSISNIV